MGTLNQLVETSARRFPDRLAVRCRQETITFRRLNERINRLTDAFQSELSLARGERVALLVPTSIDLLCAYLAVCKAGAVAAPMNLGLLPSDIVGLAEHLEPHVVITAPSHLDTARQIAERVATVRNGVVVGEEPSEDWPSLRALVRSGAPEEPTQPVSEEDIAVCLYTSGTTGRPKGILLSHGNITANVLAHERRLDWEVATHVFACPLPLHHIFPMTLLVLFPWSIGATVVLIPTFKPERCLATIARTGTTFFAGVPWMFALFNKVRDPQRYDLSRCRYWNSGGAALPAIVGETFLERFGAPVYQGYGLSETSPTLSWNLDETKLESVGPPLPGVLMKILDEDGGEVAPGAIGEVVVSGPSIMQGYYRDPEATAAAIREGWFHTGDLGWQDSEGTLTLVGRKKELIIVAGENVFPEELDEFLCRHDAVDDAAVVGIGDPLRGESIIAYVVPKEKPSEALRLDLVRYCRTGLARVKVPRQIEFRDSIPRNPIGKVLRLQLAEEAARSAVAPHDHG